MALFTNLSLKANTLQPLHTLLPKLRVNQNFSSIITSCSPYIGGLGLPSIEMQKFIEIIDLVISYFLSKTLTAFYLKDSVELLQLKSGLDSHIFKADFDRYSHLTIPCWLKHLWSLLYSINLKLYFSSSYHLLLNFGNNISIITSATSLNTFSKVEMYHLNTIYIQL